MEVTESSLASALEGFYVPVRVSPERTGSYEVADADELASVIFATLSRMAALREPEPPRAPIVLHMGDPELSAIGCILAALEDLDGDAVERVLAYVGHRSAGT